MDVNATVENTANRMYGYIANKEISNQQWDEIIQRFRKEACALLQGRTSDPTRPVHEGG